MNNIITGLQQVINGHQGMEEEIDIRQGIANNQLNRFGLFAKTVEQGIALAGGTVFAVFNYKYIANQNANQYSIASDSAIMALDGLKFLITSASFMLGYFLFSELIITCYILITALLRHYMRG